MPYIPTDSGLFSPLKQSAGARPKGARRHFQQVIRIVSMQPITKPFRSTQADAAGHLRA
jgi:hypothetical protein